MRIKRLVTILNLILIFLITMVVILYFSLLGRDISLQTLYTAAPHPQGVYLISYAFGDDVFFQNQNALMESAINKGIDGVFNYNHEHLDPAFVAKNQHIFDQSVGAGYWLWKPWIIQDTLKRIPEDAILIYADSGIVFKRPLTPLLEAAKEHGIILIEHPIFSREAESQNATLTGLGCTSEECRQGRNVIAGFMLIKNNAANRAFVKKWLDACQNPKYLIDQPGTQPESDAFVKHKHDQSILGIMAYQHRDQIKTLSYKFLHDNFLTITFRKPDTRYRTQEAEIYKYSLFGRLEYKLSNTSMFMKIREIIITLSQHFPWRSTYYKEIDLAPELKNPH